MARQTYEKTYPQWKDKPDETTPILAENLNHIEEGIKTAMDDRALREKYGDENLILRTNITGSEVTGSGNITNGNYNKIGSSGTQSNENSVGGNSNIIRNGNQNIVGGLGNILDKCNQCFASGYENKMDRNGSLISCSSIFGKNNISVGSYQAVFGKFNSANENFAFIVGGGTSETDRKNIYVLDWNGNIKVLGDVTNGAGVSLNGLKSDIDNIEVIAEGGAIAKVFDTKADLDTWLEVAGNAETLVVGQNIYIVEAGTPDYWWDGTGLQVLETDKVEIESMTYDETMSVLNATAEEVA